MKDFAVLALGDVLGKPLRLRIMRVRFMNDHRADWIIFDGRTLRLDGALPGDVSRLLPPGYVHSKASDWLPFVRRAILHNLL